MAWKPTKPEPNDDLDYSVNDIEGNFDALNTMLTPNAPTLNLTSLSAAPAALANTMQLFTQTDGTHPQLWIQREAGSTDTPALINATGSEKANPGYTLLPSGLMLIWGTGSTVAHTGPTSYALMTPTGSPGFPNAMLDVWIKRTTLATGDGKDNIVSTQVVDKSHFTITRLSGYHGTNFNFTYLAIGY